MILYFVPATQQFKPNDLPDLELSAVKSLSLRYAGTGSTVTTFTITSPNLTFSAPTGTTTATIATKLTAGAIGEHIVLTTAVLANGETIKATFRVTVVDSTSSRRDY